MIQIEKSCKSNKMIYISLYIVLILLNVFLLWTNIELRIENFKRMDNNDISTISHKMDMQIKRYNSLIRSRKLQDERIENIVGRMPSGTKQHMIDLSKNTLIIAVSKNSCSKCLLRELKYFNNINQKGTMNVVGIYKVSEESYLQLLFRSLQIDFQMYALVPEEFLKLSFSTHFPQIYFLRNNRIISSLFPIPVDDEFSENYYNILIK